MSSFAVAVNVLLTFFPFLVAMILLCRYVLQYFPEIRLHSSMKVGAFQGT